MPMENEKDSVFEETFSDLLKDENKEPTVVYQPEETLDEALFGKSEMIEPLSAEMLEKISQEYIPPSVGDEEWEEFVGRVPLPPISRLDEARAVSIGLQELRKQKEYVLYIHNHMFNEFTKIYATYPLLLSKDMEELFTDTSKKAVALMEDMEHLIAGDFDQLEATKQDFRLHQVFEEKRLSVLYDLLEHYNKKK